MDRHAIIRAESQRLADVLAVSEPEAAVPTCPEWNALDLLWHLTEVHWFWSQILARGADVDIESVERDKPPRPAAVAELLELRAQGTEALLTQLEGLSDDDVRWSWWEPDQTAGFTRRMQTYEATMHRVDAELTAGLPVGAIAAEVAAGAVDHAVDIMWGWRPGGATYEAVTIAAFEATDTGQNWLVEVGRWAAAGFGSNNPSARRAAGGQAVAMVRAPVEDLALWAWTRGGSVTLTGESSAVAALTGVVANGMP